MAKRLIIFAFAALLTIGGAVFAQDNNAPEGSPEPAPPPLTEAAAGETSTEEFLSEEELDDLVAPVALYPDALLAQVFVATTYPLDIVKADRWLDETTELEGEARTAAAEREGWDPSVAVLAAGFPSVLDRMAENLDWIEQTGDALLAQSDDVLDAVQRMRARADALGNLESNEAQQVTIENDQITITPADPEVVYVPAYDSKTTYTTPVTAAPVVASPTQVDSGYSTGTAVTSPTEMDSGYSTGSMVATGVIAFGAGILINELFDDDDDDWHGYWGPGYRHFDWDDDNFYPRPGRGSGNFSGNDVDIDVGEINVDRDRLNIDRDGAWRPNRARQNDARAKIANRNVAQGDRVRNRRPAGQAARAPRDTQRADLKKKINARSDDGKRLARTGTADRKRPQKKASKSGAFGNKKGSLSSAKKAKNRGSASTARAKAKRQNKAKPARAQRVGKQQKIGRPAGRKKAASRKPAKQSAFSRGGGGDGKRAGRGRSANKAKARGSRSAGKRRRRG